MKKLLLVVSLAISTGVFSQNNLGKGIVGSAGSISTLPSKQNSSAVSNMAQTNSPLARTAGTNPPQVQSVSCGDTLRYAQIKQIVLYPGGTGSSNFGIFSVYKSDNEAISQTFKHAGGTSVSIKGVEFYGNKSTSSSTVTPLVVKASIYSVDINGAPLTSLGSRTISVATTTAGYRYVNFSSPITVTSDYAVVLEATSTGGVLEYYVTSTAPGEVMDGENLTRYKSSYYPKSAGVWVTIPALTTGDATNFPSGPYDFEPLISPIVSYNINTAFTATPNPLCLGTALSITNNTTPTDLLKNRMYNYGSFMHYFGQYPQDSLYLWDMGNGSPLIWDVNTAYTYTAAGTYTVDMGTLGGFWHNCFDMASTTITVNALPNVTATPASTAVCVGTNISLAGGGASTYTWTGGVTNASTFTPTSTTYTVSGTDANGCINKAVASVTVNTLPNVTATPASTAVCAGTNITLTGGGTATTFTWTGGVTNATPFAPASTDYTVSGTDANGCKNTAVASVTVNALPTVTATPSSTVVCAGTDITLTAGGTATTFTWSNGVINSSTFTPISNDYTVTGTDGNGCKNTAIASVTVNSVPTVSANTTASVICSGENVTLTGGGATSYTWSSSVVDGTPFAPTGTNTYTVTGVTNGCAATATVGVTVSLCTGIASISAANSAILVYPNPNNGEFTLKANKAETVMIINELGQSIQTIELTQHNGFTHKVSNLGAGIYFLTGTVTKQKVVVTQ